MQFRLTGILLATMFCAAMLCTACDGAKPVEDPHDFTYYSYEGLIGTGTDAALWFVVRDDDLAAGQILYTAKSTTPISLYGEVLRYEDGTSEVYLNEYLPDGHISGHILAEWRGAGRFEGDWYTTSKSYRLAMEDVAGTENDRFAPSGKQLPNPLRTIGENEIGSYSKYSYTFDDPRHGELGGTAEFFTPHRDAVTFDIETCTPNLACVSNGESTVQTFLDRNLFTYRMSECGYSMEVEFFENAVHVKGLSYDPDCFGMNALPDGWYILETREPNGKK